jgi:conjugative transposon TraJ protein
MKNKTFQVAFIATLATLLPLFSHAQGVADSIHSLQSVLDTLFDQMLPLCSKMIDLGRGIAGFAAMWFIAMRVWRHIAAAEPVDFYPLLRPFAIGFCILSFPMVLALINGVLKPTITATHDMVGDSNHVIQVLTDPNQAEVPPAPGAGANADPEKWYQYSHPDNSSASGTNTNPIGDMFSDFSLRNMFKKMIAEILNVLFEAAALCIDTIRTFKLIVLAILGPICFGLSIFEGFQHTLKQWLARYVNVYMWLPVANIFGAILAKIQANMIVIERANSTDEMHVNSTNGVYLIFMVIGIIGYFTVPSIANYIINVGGHALFSKTSSLASTAIVFGASKAATGMISANQIQKGGDSSTAGSGSTGNGENYMKNKLSGNT